ncbi:hypothetical protein SCHPADRAFT_173357 [Schizopora paradoxa]|uniref:Uncharacterized protein n=1 Tax=Schizopora paradoxa TaxID=27342 RepID=A0A0H2RYY7_9AGAM|nr:hypothetical protein SCHPADRAFT_173357 [Schizopora paradoxa]
MSEQRRPHEPMSDARTPLIAGSILRELHTRHRELDDALDLALSPNPQVKSSSSTPISSPYFYNTSTISKRKGKIMTKPMQSTYMVRCPRSLQSSPALTAQHRNQQRQQPTQILIVHAWQHLLSFPPYHLLCRMYNRRHPCSPTSARRANRASFHRHETQPT